jgi:membrane protein DedA with SNARE-associated domain
MSTLLVHGSLLLVFAWLIVGGVGIPLPEDVAVIGAGVLAHRGEVHPLLALGVVVTGVLAGDAILFLTSRRLGTAALDREGIRKLLPPERRAKIQRAYARHGGRLVFLARHVAGLRGAVFAMAGMNGMAPRRFFLWDSLAASISVPLVFGLGFLGSQHIDHIRAGVARTEHHVLFAAALLGLAYVTWRHLHLRSAARPEGEPVI